MYRRDFLGACGVVSLPLSKLKVENPDNLPVLEFLEGGKTNIEEILEGVEEVEIENETHEFLGERFAFRKRVNVWVRSDKAIAATGLGYTINGEVLIVQDTSLSDGEDDPWVSVGMYVCPSPNSNIVSVDKVRGGFCGRLIDHPELAKKFSKYCEKK